MPPTARNASPTRRIPVLVLGLLVAAVIGAVLGHVLTAPGPAADTRPGPVDIGFSQDMSTHHAQAVLMASLADSRAGPAVTAIANSILIDQSQELGAMRGWLGLWGEPLQTTVPMAWMATGGPTAPAGPPDGAMTAGGSMPGMASPEELATLWGKSGNDFDVMFMQLMIRHHQGGQIMAGYAASHATLDVVRHAAATMQFEQAEEIGSMRALLSSYGARPLPAP